MDIKPGWGALIERLAAGVEQAVTKTGEGVMPRVTQVKEKFGLLKVHLHCPDNWPQPLRHEVVALVTTSEAESAQVCEVCGELGAPDERPSWHRVRCRAHKEG